MIPIDPNATFETKKLLANLHQLRKTRTLFGHQDSLAYGRGWTTDNNPNNRVSDVYDSLTAKQYPAVFGWDVGKLETGATRILNYIDKNKLRQHIQFAHSIGCVNTISWHAINPISDIEGDKGDGTTVSKIINTSSPYHTKFKAWLKLLADFFKSLTDANGKLIPIIFRPYHEVNVNNCFWWDKDHCSPTQYKDLWKLTVQYLRDTCQVHNLLYAFSLNDGFTNTHFTNFYPGNSLVDVIGFDAYQRPGTNSLQYIAKMQSQLDSIIALSNARNKLPAITEMGCNNLANANGQIYDSWFTQVMYACIKQKQIAYCMLWRNPKGAALGDGTEFYCSYPGHATVTDFNVFFRKIEILFSKTTGNKKLFT